MHRLMVLYPPPEDPDHSRRYYAETHLPLAEKIPGLKGMRYGLGTDAFEGDSPYFCVWEGDFEDEEAMTEALQSAEGQATSGDVPNYASGGAILLHFEAAEQAHYER